MIVLNTISKKKRINLCKTREMKIVVLVEIKREVYIQVNCCL